MAGCAPTRYNPRMAGTRNTSICPACGDDTKQVALGRLWDRLQIVCHCRTCRAELARPAGRLKDSTGIDRSMAAVKPIAAVSQSKARK
jgi:hypothetical protein